MRSHSLSGKQMPLPGVPAMDGGNDKIELPTSRIPHYRILAALNASQKAGRSIPEIYLREVVPVPTRTIQLLGHKCHASILHSLLGFEVQASYKRIHCPDMPTARYIKLFTEIGCRRIRIPYDPTVTEKLLDELEAAFAHLEKGVRELFPHNPRLQLYVFRKLCSWMRVQMRNERYSPPSTDEIQIPVRSG